jgi:zona occludens toxin (predicted ATPase)
MGMRALILTLGCGAILQAQAIIEYGVNAGNSSAAGASIGGSTKKIVGQLDKVLAGAAKGPDPVPASLASSAIARPAAAPAAAPAQAAAPAPPADLSGVTVGMEKSELIANAGKPWMAISGMDKSTVTETLTYRTEAGSATVILRAGKVDSIKLPEASPAK